ncbi:cold shock domain-containing protein [Ornithinimicrobium sp. F0845]|uniref:cold-shock protein n=1 Tax=Ornithinimicrobium sp. F0845 TaxID=2926412 RepID=UPI001FF58CCA|nr:cold shock domain-containing protein [Ornithinimicrobium sp. F0845]
MPTGKVRFYDEEKGFGFLSSDEGQDVYVHASVLPAGVKTLARGARVEFDIAQGRRGDQALHVRLLEPAPSVSRSMALRDRKPADEMAVVVEDLIKLLDDSSNSLRRGRYPDKRLSGALAKSLRAVADQFEAGA